MQQHCGAASAGAGDVYPEGAVAFVSTGQSRVRSI